MHVVSLKLIIEIPEIHHSTWGLIFSSHIECMFRTAGSRDLSRVHSWILSVHFCALHIVLRLVVINKLSYNHIAVTF